MSAPKLWQLALSLPKLPYGEPHLVKTPRRSELSVRFRFSVPTVKAVWSKTGPANGIESKNPPDPHSPGGFCFELLTGFELVLTLNLCGHVSIHLFKNEVHECTQNDSDWNREVCTAEPSRVAHALNGSAGTG